MSMSIPSSSSSTSPSSVNNPTRILLLQDFSPELKTRDLLALFCEFEDDRGGFKLKWIDETSCWIVFSDGAVGTFVARRSILRSMA